MATSVELREQIYGEKRWAWCKTEIEPNMLVATGGDATATELLPNHEFAIRNGALLKGVVKCRKIAHSWGGVALKALSRAATEDGSTTIIASYDEAEAKQKLKFLDRQFAALREGEKRRLRMSDGSEARTFANGSYIEFIARKAPTGAGAAIELDEFSIEPKGAVTAGDILAAAIGCITHTGTITVGGTQRGEETVFNQIVSGNLEQKMRENPLFENLPIHPWVIGEFPWWESPALSRDVPLATKLAPAMETHERVQRFGNDKLQFEFVSYCSTPTQGLDMFQREFEMAILDDKDSYFDLDLISSAYPRYAYSFYTPPVIDGRKYRKGVVNDDLFQPAFRLIDRLRRALMAREVPPGEWGFSMDIGRDGDRDEIWIGQTAFTDSRKLLPRLCIGMDLMPFPGKEEIVDYIMENLPISRGYVDGTHGSVGRQFSEWAHRKYGQAAMPFVFTSQNKTVIASGLRARLEHGDIILPPKLPTFDRLEKQLLKIKKYVSKTNNVLFDTERNKGEHGDCAWSLMMLSELFATAQTWEPRRGAVGQQVGPRLSRAQLLAAAGRGGR